jgi:hypothetical protein
MHCLSFPNENGVNFFPIFFLKCRIINFFVKKKNIKIFFTFNARATSASFKFRFRFFFFLVLTNTHNPRLPRVYFRNGRIRHADACCCCYSLGFEASLDELVVAHTFFFPWETFILTSDQVIISR